MIDTQALIASIDLLSMIRKDTELRRVASTGGGEYAGPCPICGGRDRFRVQPQEQRWLCRHCTEGKWRDPIAYVMTRDNLDFKAACEKLSGGDMVTTHIRPSPKVQPAYNPPDENWQKQALVVVERCQEELWKPRCKPVLEYLHSRGLEDSTIEHFRLGYVSTGDPHNYGVEIGGLYIPRGITIPCIVRDEVWYIKVRLVPGIPYKCAGCGKIQTQPGLCACGENNKYRGVKGNRPAAIFNGQTLLDDSRGMALFVEGEFDCMASWQALGEWLPVVTLGSASNLPDLATWGLYLIGLRSVIACYDEDEAGRKGLEGLIRLTEFVKLAPLPKGKDINDFVMAGGDLQAWFRPYLEAYRPA